MIDSNYNTEVPADLPEEQASQPIVKIFVARSKAKAKPQRREPVDLPSITPMNERKWIDIEPGESSISAYEISKKVIFFDTLKQYNEKTTEQFNSGRSRIFFRINFHRYFLADDRWKACLAAGGGAKRRYQYCTDFSGTILHFRALQGHSGRNLIDPL